MTDTVNDKTDQYLMLILNDREIHDEVYSKLRTAKDVYRARAAVRKAALRLNHLIPEFCEGQIMYTNNLTTVLVEYMFEGNEYPAYYDRLLATERKRKEVDGVPIEREPEKGCEEEPETNFAPLPDEMLGGWREHAEKIRKRSDDIMRPLPSDMLDALQYGTFDISLLTPTEEEDTMASAPEFKTVNMIDGQNIDDISDNRIIEMIARCKKQIERLKEVGVDSKAINAKIKEQEDAIAKLVETLDSRV